MNLQDQKSKSISSAEPNYLCQFEMRYPVALNRAVVSRGAGGALAPRNMGVLFTLFQPEGADYAHHITASTPGFENLTTSLPLFF
jgi:hypothetical protein